MNLLIMIKSLKTLIKKKEVKFLILLGVIGIIYIYNQPVDDGPILPCIIQKVTGFQCPGCGLTRSIRSFLHFEFREAFYYNKLLFTIFPLILISTFITDKKKKNYFIYLLLFLTIAYGIIRNII